MFEKINWIRNNIINARKEDGYGLLMDKTSQLYYIPLEIVDFLVYILNTDTQTLISEISESIKYNEPQLTNYYLKITGYLNKPKISEKTLTEKTRAELAFSTKNLKFKAPIYASFQILDICNLKCIHCFNDSKSNNTKIMPLNDVKNVIDQLSDFGVFILGLTGGETLMHPNILEIIKYATSKRMQITMNSNGTLLTYDLAKKLKENGLNSLHISIDGRKEHHNSIRGTEYAFDKSIEALKIAKEVGLNPTIFNVVLKNNIEDVDYMLDLAKELDVAINIRRFIPIGRGANEQALMLDSDDVTHLLNTIDSHINKNVIIDRCYIFNSRKANCRTCNKTVCTITKDGNLFPCPYVQADELKLGNIFSNNIKDLYCNIDKHIFLDVHKENLSDPCNSCNDFDICYGGCRATAYICNNKSRNGLDPQCSRVHEKLKLAK